MVENVFVLMPAYNAEATVEKVFERIPAEARARIRRYFVVDDGSTDGTAAALARIAREIPTLSVLSHGTNRGYGEAEKTLLRSALAEGVEVGILLHADGQYSPEKIPELLEPSASRRERRLRAALKRPCPEATSTLSPNPCSFTILL